MENHIMMNLMQRLPVRRKRAMEDGEMKNENGDDDEQKDDLEGENEDVLDQGDDARTCDTSRNADNVNLDSTPQGSSNSGQLSASKNGVHDYQSEMNFEKNCQSETKSEENLQHQDSNDAKPAANIGLKPQYAGCHRAGFDAFMTGFAMATFVSQYGRPPPTSDDVPSVKGGSFVETYGLQDLVNKLYLGGKDVPLQITQSHFSKPSANHREKMKRIFKS